MTSGQLDIIAKEKRILYSEIQKCIDLLIKLEDPIYAKDAAIKLLHTKSLKDTTQWQQKQEKKANAAEHHESVKRVIKSLLAGKAETAENNR